MLKKLFFALVALCALLQGAWAVGVCDTITMAHCMLTVGYCAVIEYVALKNI